MTTTTTKAKGKPVDAKRAEIFALARELALATISVGALITSPQAARGFVHAAREIIDEIDKPTPLPAVSTLKQGQQRSRNGASTSDEQLGDMLGELGEEL